MWKRYRKTLIPIQIFILLVLILLVAHWHVPAGAAVVFFLVMQLGAVAGAAWGARLNRKLTRDPNALPLRSRPTR